MFAKLLKIFSGNKIRDTYKLVLRNSNLDLDIHELTSQKYRSLISKLLVAISNLDPNDPESVATLNQTAATIQKHYIEFMEKDQEYIDKTRTSYADQELKL